MNREKRQKMWKMAHLTSLGPTVAFSIFIGLGIGVWLDKKFETTPWLTLIFLGFGIAAAFRNIGHAIRKLEKLEREDKL